MKGLCFYLTVVVDSVPSSVHSATWESPVPKSGSQSVSNTNKREPVEVDITSGNLNLCDVQASEVDFTVLLASATDKNAGKSVIVCDFSRKN